MLAHIFICQKSKFMVNLYFFQSVSVDVYYFLSIQSLFHVVNVNINQIIHIHNPMLVLSNNMLLNRK